MAVKFLYAKFIGFCLKKNDVSFSCVCQVTDHEFRHNIVKVAVDQGGDSRVDPQTTLTMLWRNSLLTPGQMHEKRTFFFFFLPEQIVKFSALVRWRVA